MTLASIDVGSNTIRMLVGEVVSGVVRPKLHAREITRLGEGVSSTGRLSSRATRASLEVLRRFSMVLADHEVSRTRAVGTSALREASNAGGFLLSVLRETGIDIAVISGNREAELTAIGASSALGNDMDSLIVDIGGGSTEFIHCRGKKVLRVMSIPLGVVKLLEIHVRSDPPVARELEEIISGVSHMVRDLNGYLAEEMADNAVFIGTGGTATTLASLDLGLETYDRQKVHMHRVSLDRARELILSLSKMPQEERASFRGMEKGRADLIIPGIILTITLMETLGFREMMISDYGLLEGLLIEVAGEVPK